MKVTRYLLSPRVKTLFEPYTSLWMSSRGSEFLVIEWKDVQTCFLEHIFHIQKLSQKKFRNEIHVNHFLDRIEVDMSQSFMSDITRLNVQSNRNRNFIIRRIYYIETIKAITNKVFSNEDIRLGDNKLIGILDNSIASSKKWRLADQISPKCGYIQDALKSQNFSWGHSEINTSSSLSLSSGVIC